MIVLTKVVQTSFANPSSWDAWDADGQYYRMRYEGGEGVVEAQPGPEPGTWTEQGLDEWLGWFAKGEAFDNVITLARFLSYLSNVELAPNAEVITP